MKRIISVWLPILAAIIISPFSLFAQPSIKTSELFGDIRARHIGPALMSGRISDIDVVNSKPEVIYVGAAGGGVWKSQSAGALFTPVFDEHTQSIGKVTIDQNHPDTVWVGTGETWVRNSVSVGDGIYKTTDGGSSWKNMGLKDSERISDIIVDPTNSNIVYVGVLGHLWNDHEERGVYKTTDGGETWEKLLYVNPQTGCADLTMDPEDPNTLYAAMWDFRRTPYSFRSGGPGSGLHKTTDGGKTWTKVTQGLPKGTLGRLAVEIAPSNRNVIYLSVEADKEEEKGLYRSDNAGESFTLVNGDFNNKVRPFYFARLTVSPSNEKIVYKCGLQLIMSEDSGATFKIIDSGMHSDIHAVWIHPTDSKINIAGTDGGLYRTLDNGNTYTMFMNLPLSQYYHVSVDMEEPFNIYGGLQDNGSWRGPSKSQGGIANKDWQFVLGGDGFAAHVDSEDKNVVYAEAQGGEISRVNLLSADSKDIKPYPRVGEAEFRFNWNAPIHKSPSNPKRLYFGSQFLFMSEDKGESWKRLSPDLTTNDPARQQQKQSGGLSTDNSAAENNTTIYAIAESPLDEKLIWVGTDDGNLQVTTDGGTTWTNVSPNISGLPAKSWCTSVEPGHFDKNTIYVTFDHHRMGDIKPYLFKSTDLGKTWVSLATPDISGYALSVREDLVNQNLVFLGTEFGLYISVDGGANWGRFSNNVPKVGIRDMVIHPRDNALVLATHGRGVIIIDDLPALRALTPEVMNKSFTFFESPQAYTSGFDFGGGWFGGAGEFVGQNPNEAPRIIYFQQKRHVFGKMFIQVFDGAGNMIKELPAGKSAGVNIVDMPTRMEKPKAAPTNNRMSLIGNVFGPDLPGGTYKAVVTKGKETFETTYTVGYDPKSPHSVEDRKLQEQTVRKLYDMTEQMAWVYDVSAKLQQQAEDLAKSQPKLAKKATAYARSVQTFKDNLVFLGGDFYVNEDERLSEKISQIYGTITRYPGSPSQSHLDRIATLEADFKVEQLKFAALTGEELQKLNSAIEKAGGETLKAQSFESFKASE
jgi:photosystem II stability/assembly factor-like uncharacterized protein